MSTKIVDKYLSEFWGDYPSLALSLHNSAVGFVQSVIDLAAKDGVVLDPDEVAERAVELVQDNLPDRLLGEHKYENEDR